MEDTKRDPVKARASRTKYKAKQKLLKRGYNQAEIEAFLADEDGIETIPSEIMARFTAGKQAPPVKQASPVAATQKKKATTRVAATQGKRQVRRAARVATAPQEQGTGQAVQVEIPEIPDRAAFYGGMAMLVAVVGGMLAFPLWLARKG
jgi:hypothetical protein